MKICAACHKHLPKEGYSKKQWKLDEYQRRCKICITNNQDIQPIPPNKQDNKDTNTKAIIKSLDSMCLGNVEKEISDEDLFKQPLPAEDCPICFLLLPLLDPTGKKYYACCGKVICSGCAHAPVYDDQGNKVAERTCLFCRTPRAASDEEVMKRLNKRVKVDGDTIAIHNHGFFYSKGMYGFKQDYTKALELWYRAGELGYAESYNNIGSAHQYGEGMEVDKQKAKHYFELSAMGGNVRARYNLGNNEAYAGNADRALKHYMIAVGSGQPNSLEMIKTLYSKGDATKDDYAKALRAYQAYLCEIRSDARDAAAAADKEYRYY